VRLRGNYWLLLGVALLAAAAIYGLLVWRRAATPGMAEVLRRLPEKDALTIHVDLSSMRKAGLGELLDGASVPEEPEYRRFVGEGGFDWKTDLDAVTVSRHKNEWYFLVSGRFDMDRLRQYALSRNGTCRNGVCDVAGVTPGRRISFYPIAPRMLAMASSTATGAVYALQQKSAPEWVGGVPEGPVWVSLNGSILKGDPALPSGGRLFGKVLADTDRTTFAVSAGMDGLSLTMKAHCPTPAEAESVRAQLDGVTTEFRKYFDRLGQKPSADDLSGLLLSGQFSASGLTVNGKWPLPLALLRKVAGGTL